ncbi:hypothetical protein [Microbacterium sp.]|uniref:hypothetical protein n=1 Tax=Microbacterium sp. TaxID=51671 RepID=UPI0028A5DDDB|nr:hypothetical protein [Microbacterium sp.]
MNEDDFERIVRRVVREELHRFHVGGVRVRTRVERSQNRAVAPDDEGAKNIARLYEYTMSIDPDGTMPKDELRHLIRMKFPEFDF